MADPAQTIESIRAVLAVGGGVADDQIADLSASYSHFSRELNQRLRRCDEYAERQLFSELLYLSQCPVDLEALVRLVAGVDQNQWAKLCASRRLEVMPKVQDELWPAIAAGLEQARQIEPLVARYRLLTLAKSPAIERLQLLRSIAAGATSAVWEVEVKRVEEIRLAEISSLGQVALKTRDLNQIELLLQEVEKSAWKTSNHRNVLALLREAHFKLQKEKAATEFQQLLPRLRAAFIGGDFDSGESLHSEAQRLLETGFLVKPEVMQNLLDIQQWVDQQQRLRRSTKKLQDIRPLLVGERQQQGQKKWIRVVIAGFGAIVAISTLAAVYHEIYGLW